MTVGLAFLLTTGGGCGPTLTSGNDAAGGHGATGGGQATGGTTGTGGTGGTDAGEPVDAFVPVCHLTDASVPSVAACAAAMASDADPLTCTLGFTCTYSGCDTVSCSCKAAPDGGTPRWSCQVLI